MAKSKHSRPIDELTGFEVLDDFEPFDQRYDIYCRSLWDERIQSDKADKFCEGYYMPYSKTRRADGFGLKEYALRNAAWHVSNVIRDISESGEFRKEKPGENRKEGFWDYYASHDEGWPEPYQFTDSQEATDDIKQVAAFSGADLVGICENDPRWNYSRLFTRDSADGKSPEIPADIPYVIVTAEAMDHELIRTVPSALSGAATGIGYTFDSMTVMTIAQYIRNLGYQAYATLNDSSLGIPLAVQAGLGEVGRNSLLITEELGPRLRIGKIYTDMPLVPDKPKSLGVKEFCNICDRCAQACPPKALPFDEPSAEIYNESNMIGVVSWKTDAEKCFKFWANQNTDCIICVRACPYNRDFTKWYHKAWLRLAKSPLRKVALWLDDVFIDRGRLKSSRWWRNGA